MTADQNDYALSLSQDELYALADLIHERCSCVPQNNGGGDCDWCCIYYGTTDLVEVIVAIVTDLRAQVDSNRRALGQEICEGLTVRAHQAPKDTASSDIIGAVFKVIDGQAETIKQLLDDIIAGQARWSEAEKSVLAIVKGGKDLKAEAVAWRQMLVELCDLVDAAPAANDGTRVVRVRPEWLEAAAARIAETKGEDHGKADSA